MGSAPLVELGALGPVRLSVGGRPVPVGGAQAEALVALLLVPAAGPQPVDRLVVDMWPGVAPPSAPTQVHGLVHGLRRATPAPAARPPRDACG